MPHTAPTPAPPTSPGPPAADKRSALLAAALRLIARSGLHDAPTSAVAREAGVAAGTLYLYFPSKEALINALYLELLGDQHRALTKDVDGAADGVADDAADDADPRELLWRSWLGLARWHLDHPEASNVMQQCRGSGILTAETRAIEQQARIEGLARFDDGIARGVLRDLPSRVFWALYAGPILALVERPPDGVDATVSDAMLRATFEGVCRGVLPGPG